MLLNLSDVITKVGMAFEKEVKPDMTNFRYCGETLPIKNCSFLNLTAENLEKGKARLEGMMTITFVLPCDRCLTDVEHKIQLEFEKVICGPSFASKNEKEENTYEIDENFMEGYSLQIEQLVYSEIIIKWPMKTLCKEQCKGICKVCGQNLNEGTCTCDNFVPDPRLASIKDIFNANKEV